jgi:hypothetical protein
MVAVFDRQHPMVVIVVDGESVDVEHDPARGTVAIRHPEVNGGAWVEEQSDATCEIADRHELYKVVRRMLRQHRR